MMTEKQFKNKVYSKLHHEECYNCGKRVKMTKDICPNCKADNSDDNLIKGNFTQGMKRTLIDTH